MSIRTRLAVAVGLVLVVTLAVLGGVMVRSTRATLVRQVDEQVVEVADRAKGWKGPPGEGGDRGRGGDESLAVRPPNQAPPAPEGEIDPDRRAVARFVLYPTGDLRFEAPSGYADDRDPPPRLPPTPSAALDALVGRIITVPAIDDSLSYRALIQREPDGDVAVTAAPLAVVDAAVTRLLRILAVVGAVALLAATLASWWLIRRGLRPVAHMVDTAAAIAAGDLSRRVPDADPRTELGRLGRALNEMLHQIEQAIQARAASEDRLRRFVADAAHELRTPLTSLRGYAELYRQGALSTPEAVANAMRRIVGEGERMARLVDDLLLLARLDQQRGLETKPLDVVPLVREAAADFCAVEPDRPLTLDLDGEAVVRGDRVRLRQVLDNLLANARTHTPPGTPVRVTVAHEGNQVEVVVADDGPGITPEDQTRIFERFWRSDPGRSRSRGGTGLGLAIVASLVQAHGGTVRVPSEPGRRATLTVRLPRASDVPRSPQPAVSSPKELARRGPLARR